MKPEILTKEQAALLERIGGSETMRQNFYLTGGTPLAMFYLHHRYSEDLVFFSEQEIDVASLQVFFHEIKNGLGIVKIDFEQSFNRNLFFFEYCNGTLKTEFTYFPFARIEQGPNHFNLQVDSLRDIAVNKLFTIYQRTKARDYIDLYLICRDHGYEVSELIKQAKIKFDTHIDPIQLGTQFIKGKEATDYPRLIREVSPEDWQTFFVEEAKQLKSQIIA